MSNQAKAVPAQEPFVAKLARYFPEAVGVHLPVEVTGYTPGGETIHEQTLIEFGTPREALFASGLPLEFGDLVRLENSDCSLAIDAAVVAVQYHNGKRAVAARFARPLPTWIIKK